MQHLRVSCHRVWSQNHFKTTILSDPKIPDVLQAEQCICRNHLLVECLWFSRVFLWHPLTLFIFICQVSHFLCELLKTVNLSQAKIYKMCVLAINFLILRTSPGTDILNIIEQTIRSQYLSHQIYIQSFYFELADSLWDFFFDIYISSFCDNFFPSWFNLIEIHYPRN